MEYPIIETFEHGNGVAKLRLDEDGSITLTLKESADEYSDMAELSFKNYREFRKFWTFVTRTQRLFWADTVKRMGGRDTD